MRQPANRVELAVLVVVVILTAVVLWTAAGFVIVTSSQRSSAVVDVLADVGESVVVRLPPTSGEIELIFEPPGAAAVAGLVADPDGAFVVEACTSGCAVNIEVLDAEPRPSLTIVYGAGDSEYLDDIEIE